MSQPNLLLRLNVLADGRVHSTGLMQCVAWAKKVARIASQILKACLYLPFLLTLSACSKTSFYQQQSYVFGTLVEVSIYGEQEELARKATAAVLTRFDQLHRKLHAWEPSPLSQLNTAFAQGKKTPIDPELAALISDATRLSVQSEHVFNPAIGGLIALWGFQSDTPRSAVPPVEAIEALRKASPRMTDIHIADGVVWSDNPAVKLDLGGYAKGYALDEAVRILQNHHIRNALVNIGGNLIALGQHGTQAWRIGIQHPRQPGMIATLDLHDGEALGTSGDYQRFFEVNHKRYSHLIDPRTGYPATGMQSVTILISGTHAGTRSDALSKPLFIGGAAHLKENTARMGVSQYLAVDAEGTKIVSSALAGRLR